MSLDPDAPLDDAPGRPRDPSDAARLVIGDTTPPPNSKTVLQYHRRRWLPWLVMGVTLAGMAAWAAAEALGGEPVRAVIRYHRSEADALGVLEEAGALAFSSSEPSAGSGLIKPSDDQGQWYPPIGTPDWWTPAGTSVDASSPRFYVPVWVSPKAKTFRDDKGGTAYQGFRTFAYCLGCVSDIGLVEVPRAQAWWVFDYADGSEVERRSIAYGNFAGGVGSGYYAVAPTLRDYTIGNRVKTAQGGGLPAPRHFVRWPGRALMFALGWRDHSGRGVPAHAMRSPGCNGFLYFRKPSAEVAKYGYAGWDVTEINWFRGWGKPWLARTGQKAI